ncbi:hypothetical protein [Microbacterium sp. 1P10AE]|jgi:phage FluMu protein Com
MDTVTASESRAGEYTAAHRCRHCARAFWGKPGWNAVSVRCPRCRGIN